MTEKIEVAPGELASLTNLLRGFLEDLTPQPDSITPVLVDRQVLEAIMVLASKFRPKDDAEVVELAYIKDTLESILKEGESDTRDISIGLVCPVADVGV